MADIRKVAAGIKRELSGRDDCDLEFLAQLFENNDISDIGSGNELQNRLLTIFTASSDGSANGVTHFAGIYASCRDRGFREAFKDPWPGKSDNQVGHFTTAVDMGFRPQQTYQIVPKSIRDRIAAAPHSSGFLLPLQILICVVLIIGHEQVADDAILANHRAALSPSMDEAVLFLDALPTVNVSPNLHVDRSRVYLDQIRVGTGQGNSIQDLHLSLFGFKFGMMINQGQILSRAAATQWIRVSLSGVVNFDEVIPPGGTTTA